MTLLVTPEDAERITLAQQAGQLMLALRNPLDTEETDTKGVLTASLFATPFSSPEFGGLAGLLLVSGLVAAGNAFATPSLTSLGSKNAAAHEQGRAMGVMQSGASLARAIGPMLCGLLLNNSMNAIDRSTIFRTYWTAAGIMLVAFFAAIFLLKNIRTAEAAL